MDNSAHNVSNGDELLTLSEVAGYLKVAEKTILRMIRRNEIPCVRIGGQWRFLRSAIAEWVLSKMEGNRENPLTVLIESGENIVPISRLIKEEHILFDIKPGSKEEILTQLVTPLKLKGTISEVNSLVKKLLQRELMASTGLGPGIAFPHLRHPRENIGEEPLLIIGICKEGAEYQALNGKKTSVFCLLCIKSVVAHLRVLARLMQMFRYEDDVNVLIKAQNGEEVLRQLIQLEQKCPRHDSNVRPTV